MGKKAPSPPDPVAVSKAQTDSNIATAREQARLAMNGSDTPTQNVTWVTDPNSPSGYRQVVQYSPEMQALLGQAEGNLGNYMDVTGQQLGRVNDRLASGDFNMDASRGLILSDIQRKMMDPQWEAKSNAFDTMMANKGIQPGSEEYQLQRRQFDQAQSDAYDKMFLDSYTTANNAALQEWLLPLTEMGMLTNPGASMPAPATPAANPAPGVAPTDVAGIFNTIYGQQVAQSSANMGGLYGLGAAGLGGWAKAGFPGAASLLALI
jgi:hypothetical protein